MKITIPNLTLASISFLFLSTLCSDICYSQQIPKVYTVKNKEYSINDSSSYFIILRNNHGCNNCYTSLNDYLLKLRNKVQANFISISECDSNSLARKRNLADTQNLMPDMNDYLFQYNCTKDNFFNNYSVDNTPVVVIVRNGKLTLIPYSEIFEISSTNISSYAHQKFLTLLNGK